MNMSKATVITVLIIIVAFTVLAIILVPKAISWAKGLKAADETTYDEIDKLSSSAPITKPVHALCVLVLSFYK